MYVFEECKCTVIDELSCIESCLECLAVECYDGNKAMFICVYRPTRGNMNDFLKTLNEFLVSVYKKYSNIYVFDDLNLVTKI